MRVLILLGARKRPPHADLRPSEPLHVRPWLEWPISLTEHRIDLGGR